MEQQNKENFWKSLKSCICDFEKYPEMATKSSGNVMKYFIILLAIFTLITTTLSVYNITKKINEGIEYIKNELPDMSFIDNKLEVNSESTIKIENENNIVSLIIINTNEIDSEEVEKYTTEIENKTSGAIFLKDKIIVNVGSGTMTYSYETISKTYDLKDMTKDEVLNNFEGYNLIMIYFGIFTLTFIYLFIAYFVSTIFDAILLTAMGYITCFLLRLRIKIIALFKISIYSLTLPIILNLIYIIIQTLFGFNIEYFEVMYVAVAYIYVIASILMIKSDIIKKQQELTKIFEEQEKVKQELEKQKEEQRQKEEEEKRKQEDKKEEKKKERKNQKKNKDNLGKEPQGENA